MRITLELTEAEAIFVKDALIDKSLDLRTVCDRLIKEDVFLAGDASDRRKRHYLTLRDTAEQIRKHFKGVAL